MIRQLSAEQRAAHLLLGIVTDLVTGLRAESMRADHEAQRARRSDDETADYIELATLARGRLEGAQMVQRRLQGLARGATGGQGGG